MCYGLDTVSEGTTGRVAGGTDRVYTTYKIEGKGGRKEGRRKKRPNNSKRV